jgi:hypothetical protein
MERSFNKDINSKDQAGVATEEKGKAGPGEEGSRDNKQIQNLHTRLYHHLMPVSLTIKKALHSQP